MRYSQVTLGSGRESVGAKNLPYRQHTVNKEKAGPPYSSAHPNAESTMIAFDSADTTLRKLREQLQKMSDDQLIAFGKRARSLAGLRVSGTGDPYQVKLDEARGERGAEAEVS
jgi:hypothetical protein